jgi:hypothetical protein
MALYAIGMISLFAAAMYLAWNAGKRAEFLPWLFALLSVVLGVIVGILGPGDPYARQGPASTAPGWTHYSAALGTPHDGNRNTVVLSNGVTIEVTLHQRISAGTVVSYSCPPDDGQNHQQQRSGPRCKEDTVRVLCAQWCPAEPSWTPWAVIIGAVIVIVVPFVARVVTRMRDRR